MKVSIIIASGSTEQNAHVRINCLWRCVNSMHDDPGEPFELIIIDNAGVQDHRDAIRQIFDTYPTVTHVVANRVNEFMGGAFRQGAMISDGEILVFAADDTLLRPGWLTALIKPLEVFPDRKYVAALQSGPNTRTRFLGKIMVEGVPYCLRARAGCYIWGLRRKDYELVAPWRRFHFADTRMANRIRRMGFVWTMPSQPKEEFLSHTNLNYLRPWEYRRDRKVPVQKFKDRYLAELWKCLPAAPPPLQPPVQPTERFPLKNTPKQ